MRPSRRRAVLCAVMLTGFTWVAGSMVTVAQQKPRARDLGVPFDGSPGAFNAITDVAGVEVGHTTLISGAGPLVRGKGPVRTGVTAILPKGRAFRDRVFAGWYSLNGNGEMTGTTWVDESGFLGSPILITNTHSVGVGARCGHRVERARAAVPETIQATSAFRSSQRRGMGS